METPGEALYEFIFGGPAVVSEEFRRRWPKPGQLLERHPNLQSKMAGLTSDEVSKMRFRPWMVMNRQYEDRQRLSVMLQDFDQRCAR